MPSGCLTNQSEVMLSGVPSRAQAADGTESKHPVQAVPVSGRHLSIPRDPSLRVGTPLSHTDAAFRMTSVFFVSQPDQQGRNHREDGLTQRRRRTQRKVFPTPLRPLREALLEAWTSFLQGTFPTQRLPARTATAAGGDGLFYSPQEEGGDDEHHLRGLRAAGAGCRGDDFRHQIRVRDKKQNDL